MGIKMPIQKPHNKKKKTFSSPKTMTKNILTGNFSQMSILIMEFKIRTVFSNTKPLLQRSFL